MSLSSISVLEQSGQWTQVLEILRQQVSLGIAIDADHFHAMAASLPTPRGTGG